MEYDIIHITDESDFDYYIDDILSLQGYVDKMLPEDYWYIQTTRDEMYNLFHNDGILLLVIIDDMIAGVSIAGNFHADYEDVRECGIKINTSKCLYYDCVFVDLRHRGKGLQKALMEETLHIAKGMGYKRSWCMVCPDNIYSLRNIEALGYDKIGESTHGDSGWRRSIMFREI